MFLGATIIAAAIVFVLTLFQALYLQDADATRMWAFITAAVKTAIFAVIFHYLHNFVAKLLGWYRLDKPDAPHRFDRSPALDQVRSGME